MAVPSNFSYPTGGTWFDTLKKSFVDVPIDAGKDNAIPTTDFLEASESLTTLFGVYIELMSCNVIPCSIILDVLGSMAFTPVKNDMIGNIKVLCILAAPHLYPGSLLRPSRKSVIVN